MPLTMIAPSHPRRPVDSMAGPVAGRSGSVTNARIVPPASFTHGPRRSGALSGPDPRIAAGGAEEGNA
jgi:hypothetical protein